MRSCIRCGADLQRHWNGRAWVGPLRMCSACRAPVANKTPRPAPVGTYYQRNIVQRRAYAAEYQLSHGMPCRECGTIRAISAKNRERLILAGGPLCRACRRTEADRLKAIEVAFRVRRVAGKPTGPRRASRGSGRSGTGNSRYRRNRLLILEASDVCGICQHGGAATVDHLISAKHWPVGQPGFNDLANLQPAHGTLGATSDVNRCPTCHRLCNQSKGSRI
jgi:hypothetical protein